MADGTARTAAIDFLQPRLLPASFLLYVRADNGRAYTVFEDTWLCTWDLINLKYKVESRGYSDIRATPELPLFYFTQACGKDRWVLWIHDLGTLGIR